MKIRGNHVTCTRIRVKLMERLDYHGSRFHPPLDSLPIHQQRSSEQENGEDQVE